MNRLTRCASLLAVGSAALASLAGLPAAVAAPARPAQARPEITLNTTALAVGTELTVAGSGCLDVGSGSAAGYRVSVGFAPRGKPDDFTYGSLRNPPFFAVEPDGSWELTATIDQPLPPGPVDLVARCLTDPNDFSEQRLYEPVAVSITLPPLTGVQVRGGTITSDYPCDLNTPLGESFLYDGDRLVAALTEVTVDGAATTVTFPVPDEVPSGTYQLVATCFGPRQGPRGAFAATIDYDAAAGPSAGPGAASPAAPVPGTPSLTG